MSVKVSVKKSFALDINLSVVEGKSATAKIQFIRKIFSLVNGFGEATISSKFEGIIRFTFIFEESMKKATSLASEKGININNNLKKQEICSDRTVVIKEILMDAPKKMIITTISEFVGVVIAIRDRDTWMSKDCFKTLLFTLPVRTTAHDLGILLEKVGGKTCVINCSLVTGNQIHCTVVGFNSDENLESAFHMEPIFGSDRLSSFERCSCFGHSVLEYDSPDVLITSPQKKSYKKIVLKEIYLQLARLYAKKCVLISCFAVFGGKSWAQIVLFNSSSSDSFFDSSSGFDSVLSFVSSDSSALNAWLAFLKCSLELLVNQISGIVWKLSGIKLVPLAFLLLLSVPAVLMTDNSDLNQDIVLDNSVLVSLSLFYAVSDASALGHSSLKILTAKIKGLESKFVALEASVNSVLVKLDQLYAGSKIAICNVRGINVLAKQDDVVHWHMESACYVSKIEEVSGQIISIRLLFKGKLSVIILGLYAGVSVEVRYVSGDFNEDSTKKSTSFKFCLDLGLVNSFHGHFLANLAFAVANHKVKLVSKFFDTDYKAVSIAVGLDGLLDTAHLITTWAAINEKKAIKVHRIIKCDVCSSIVLCYLSCVKKSYHKSKYYEFKATKDEFIRRTIDKCMKYFCFDKKKMIKSVLNCHVWKVVLDHLVVDDELVLELQMIKSMVDTIMED
ncbi:hypothetical protein G9A89_004015 [Geosiphon pyriformis]|nr:hypothetical protein G9A89_004015 [Geosiphon pyriformis]